MYVDARGWHLISHHSTSVCAGGYYYSADGHTWYTGDGLAYDCSVTWDGGYAGAIVARQRPWIVADGSAKYLYTGAALQCTDCPWCKWGCQYKHSFTMVQQIV